MHRLLGQLGLYGGTLMVGASAVLSYNLLLGYSALVGLTGAVLVIYADARLWKEELQW
jgi:hypothetical protein